MLGRKHLALMGLLLASNAGAYGGTIWFERADYPSSCSAACGPVLGAVDSCDALHKAKTARLECICDWTWASTQIPLCAACISKYGDEDDSEFVSYYHYNDDGDDSDDDENRKYHIFAKSAIWFSCLYIYSTRGSCSRQFLLVDHRHL